MASAVPGRNFHIWGRSIRERQVQSLRLRRQREQQLGRFLEEPGEEAGEEALRRGSSRKGRVEEEADSVQRVCAAFYHWLDRRLDQCASAGPIRCWMPGVERTEEEGLPCSGGTRFPVLPGALVTRARRRRR